MFQRRVEITRDRWTRFWIRGAATAACPCTCELVTVAEAAERTGMLAEMIDLAIDSGLIPMWRAGAVRLVFIHKVQKDQP